MTQKYEPPSGGARSSKKRLTCSFPRLDIRDLKRWGILVPGRTSVVHWTGRVDLLGLITVDFAGEKLFLELEMLPTDPLPVTNTILIASTPCHFGGTRPWFLCPTCGRRVAVLFLYGIPACRKCHDLAYPVENETKINRLFRRSRKLRTRLGAKHGIFNPVIRPPGMRRRRFERESSNLDDVELRLRRGVRGWLGALEPPSAEELLEREVERQGLEVVDGAGDLPARG